MTKKEFAIKLLREIEQEAKALTKKVRILDDKCKIDIEEECSFDMDDLAGNAKGIKESIEEGDYEWVDYEDGINY